MRQKISTIHDLAIVDRPREKLEKYGSDKLSDIELLAILLKTGRKGMNVLELARKVLQYFPLEKFNFVTLQELSTIKGIGPAKASELIAMIELGRRILKDKKRDIYLKPKDIWESLVDIRTSMREHFIVLYLNSRNQEIVKEIVSVGSLNTSIVHPREVFESAIKNHAASIMLVHNHPSNDLNPSQADIDITSKLIKSGEILDIEVLDHVIIGKDGWYSFKEKGKI